MTAAARKGDPISHGGEITSGSPTVTCNSIPLARVGDAVSCAIHGAQTITSGSPTWLANGKQVARVGSAISCGAVVSGGSPTVVART